MKDPNPKKATTSIIMGVIENDENGNGDGADITVGSSMDAEAATAATTAATTAAAAAVRPRQQQAANNESHPYTLMEAEQRLALIQQVVEDPDVLLKQDAAAAAGASQVEDENDHGVKSKIRLSVSRSSSTSNSSPNPKTSENLPSQQGCHSLPGAYAYCPFPCTSSRSTTTSSTTTVTTNSSSEATLQQSGHGETSLPFQDLEGQPNPQQPQESQRLPSSVNGRMCDSEKLVVANALTESQCHTNLPIAQEWHPTSPTTRKAENEGAKLASGRTTRRRHLLLLFCLGVFLALGIFVAVFLKKSSSGSSSSSGNKAPTMAHATNDPTISTTTSRAAHLQSLLPNDTLQIVQKDIDLLLATSGAASSTTGPPIDLSPQYQAYQWLIEDDDRDDNSRNHDEYADDLPDFRIRQRFALATLFFATHGSDWTFNALWLDPKVHECHWFQRPNFVDPNQATLFSRFNVSLVEDAEPVNDTNPCQVLEERDSTTSTTATTAVNNTSTSSRVMATDGILQHLWLYNNNLQGQIPNDIYTMLPSLKSISLYMNDLQGTTIPTQIGMVSNTLQGINLVRTGLSGSLPATAMGRLTQLKVLALSDNSLTGSIPSEIGQMGALVGLSLDTNQLSAAIPTALGLLTDHLRGIHLFQNILSSRIPSELGRCTNLVMLRLEAQTAPQPSIQTVYAMAGIYGSIPLEIGQMSSLEWLALSNNQLEDTIPSELANLGALKKLELQNNHGLSGTLPPSFGAPLVGNESKSSSKSRLEHLDIRNTSIWGNVPEVLCTSDRNATSKASAATIIPTVHASSSRIFFDCSDRLCGCQCQC